MKGVYIFLANGFEEMEALAPLDILRRGGVDVKTVSIHRDKYVTGSHKATVVADMTYDEFKAEVQLDGTEENDVMIFPGGMPGTRRIAENAEIINFMRNFFSGGLKDNPHLAYGFLTGILRVAKESIFSGLNNLKINYSE